MTLQQALEALIFASPKPISTGELLAAIKAAAESCELAEVQQLAESGEADVLAALQSLGAELEGSGRAFRLEEQASGWTLMTHSQFAPWVKQLYPEAKPARLSGPALETLAIIAYRQPVTRADIEAVRGVAVDSVMQVLLDRSLVKITGRADLPGRPLLYATTGYFLEHFGLKSVTELPNSDELRRVDLPKAAPVEDKKAAGKKERKMEGIEDLFPESASGAAPGPDATPAQGPVPDAGGASSGGDEPAPGEQSAPPSSQI